MTHDAHAPAARQEPMGRVAVASLIGTTIEFFDFYAYGIAAALVLNTAFFPELSETAGTLAAFSTFAVAFLARPIGSMLFGHFGDRIGRKSTLVASLLIMGGSTLLVAFLPTYAQAGWIAPFMLCLLRFGQGFGLGGEWGGAALLAVENAPPGRRARFGMFPQLGAPVGFIAANGLFLILGAILTPEQFQAWGWRLPFLGSILLVGVGLWIRLKLTETPAFAAAAAEAPPPHVPVAELFRTHGRETISGVFAVVACFALFYLTTAFALGYGVTTLGYDRQTFLSVLLFAILFMAGGIVWAGYWSDASTPRKVLMAGSALTVVVGALLAPMLGGGSLWLVGGFLSLSLLIMGLVYGPLGAWLPSLFPARVRYTGASIAFNVGGIIGGGLAPVAAQYLASRGGLGLVGVYLAGAGLVSLLALWPLKKTPDAL